MPFQILLVTHYFPERRTGIELVAAELARRFAKHGGEVTWAAGSESEHEEEPIAGVSRLPMRSSDIVARLTGFAFPLWSPLSLWRLALAVRKCDVVHLHEALYPGNVWTWCVARCLGKPIVMTQHMGQIPRSSDLSFKQRVVRVVLGAANRVVARSMLASANATFFISQSVEKYFRRLGAKGSHLSFLPNGVDQRRFRPLEEEDRRQVRTDLGLLADEPIILFVGRMVDKKGLPIMRQLAARLPQCRFVFAGRGPIDPGSWELANVTMLGGLSQQRLVPYYQAADFLVLPSVIEGFPLVVQEAMACGTPAIITTEVAAAMRDVGDVASACEPTTVAFARCLDQLLSERESWPERRARAVAFARHHWNWDLAAAVYLAAFERLISGSRTWNSAPVAPTNMTLS